MESAYAEEANDGLGADAGTKVSDAESKAKEDEVHKNGDGKYAKTPPPESYSVDPPIPHPHIVSQGAPPPFDKDNVPNWQSLMKSHLKSSCIHLCRIVVEGYKPYDETNLTRREVVDCQLDATALNMIQKALSPKEYSYIRRLETAKEAWDHLELLYIGNASIQDAKFSALHAESEAFVMEDGETAEEMYRRLTTLCVAMKDHGADYVDEVWKKRKFVQAILPFEKVKMSSIKGRSSFVTMTANDILSEITSMNMDDTNADDVLARYHALKGDKRPSVALKASTHVDEEEGGGDWESFSNEDIRYAVNNHICLAMKGFWKDGRPPKDDAKRLKNNARVRNCYNCGKRGHFIADCIYQNREDNGGRLVLKSSSKNSYAKNHSNGNKFQNKKKEKQYEKVSLITREEYMSDDDNDNDDDDDEETKVVGSAAIATTSSTPPSLFASPNEGKIIKHRCLMAKESPVMKSISSPTPSPKHASSPSDNESLSLKVKREIVSFDNFLKNLKGEARYHVGNIISNLTQANGTIEEKDNEISQLLEGACESSEEITRLENTLEGLTESHNLDLSQVIKERDHARAKCKVLKNDKVEFEVGHKGLDEELEKLKEEYTLLESKFSTLTKSHEQLQIQLAKDKNKASASTHNDISYASNPCCEHVTHVKTNTKAKAQIKKGLATTVQGGNPTKGKEGIGYVPQSKKKNKKKKE